MKNHRKLYLLLSALLALTIIATGCVAPPAGGGAAQPAGDAAAPAKEGGFVIGVSNTLVGNGWREQMICAIKAQATASGLVDKVVVVNRNGGPTEQIADLEGLISQGVNAIIVNPTDREGLNAVIESAIAQGIVVVAVDQAVTAQGAYVVTNDQTAYARVGAEWLFEKIGGKGKVALTKRWPNIPTLRSWPRSSPAGTPQPVRNRRWILSPPKR
jgi:ribose transport system substrate-binding protein